MAEITPPAGWSIVDGKLHREFTFKDFTEAFGFMTKVLTVISNVYPSGAAWAT